MNTIQQRLHAHVLKQTEPMSLIDVRDFMKKYTKRIIRATLFIQYMRASKLYNLKKKLDPENDLPIEILQIIILDYVKHF